MKLESDGILTRKVYAEVPAKVVYKLTSIERDFIPVWGQLDTWGRNHKSNTQDND